MSKKQVKKSAIRQKINELQEQLLCEKDYKKFIELSSKVNSLSVDLDNLKKQSRSKGPEYVPDQIIIYK